MGHNFSSEPVVEKETERDHNDTFNVAVSSCQGWRTSQEDNHSLMLDLPGQHKAAFFAVYDGHGSARVSKHASESLWQHLIGNDLYNKGNFREALESSFLAFDREVNESYNAQLAGTTAVCVLIVDNVIYCANIGDSRAVASVNCECVPLSYDHKPENPHELKRILAAGGYVLGNRVNGNLALSRAFGDFHYKGNDQLPADQQIVSPCPDIKDLELTDDVDFLVLACDGIWDVLSSEEVTEFVITRLMTEMEPGLICEELTTRCLATDYELVIGCDNMTVLLICYTRGRSWEEFCEDIHAKYTRKMRTKPVTTTQAGQNTGRSSRVYDDALPPLYSSNMLDNSFESDEASAENISKNNGVPESTESEEPPTDILAEEAPNEDLNIESQNGSETTGEGQETERCDAVTTTDGVEEEKQDIICKEHVFVIDSDESSELKDDDNQSCDQEPEAQQNPDDAEPTSQISEENQTVDSDDQNAITFECQLGLGEVTEDGEQETGEDTSSVSANNDSNQVES